MSDVLIVDDNPSERAFLRALLQRNGYRVHEATNATEAVERALKLRPHVIVVDADLPDADGIATCRAIRADPLIGGIPVLFSTSRDREAGVLTGLEAGADDYVLKDMIPQVFLGRVGRLVRYRQMANATLINEQMAQIGRLLAGIVHEIRGPLGVIRGNAELMKLQFGESDPMMQYAEPIIRSAQVLQLRLEHLMATVRGGPSQFRPLPIVPLIREAAEYFRKGSDPRQGRIDVTTDLDEAVPPVHADPGRLLQVLLNLLSNAREAVLSTGSSGQIRIGTRAAPGSAEGDNPTRPGVVIEVQDSGPGISAELLERIFEPFFTTKETGTGYGLYLAREIVREHGGRLSAHNLPDRGASFSLWLPSISLPEESPIPR